MDSNTATALFLLVFHCQCTAVLLAEEPSLTIQLKAGQIRGKRESVPRGQVVDVFLGIPYAQPPIGDLRFASPRPIQPWSGIHDATKYAPQCPRGEIIGHSGPLGVRNEDCLFINVYKPAHVEENQQLPVMVWIHGGGLYHGAGSKYDGSVLASYNDVIIVTLNYRLGLLGFLHVPGTELKGNYGMLDQVLALRWVQENIGSFRGNPGRVTLFGESAGGVSTDLHILSPLSKGLFNRAIIESSAATTPFAFSTDGNPERYVHFVEKLNCAGSKQLLSCLRNKTSDEIIQVQGAVEYLLIGNYFPTPVVDGEFLPDTPTVLLREGRFNQLDAVIIGTTKDEGDLFLATNALQPNPNFPPVSFTSSKHLFQAMFEKVFLVANGQNQLARHVIAHEYTNHSDPDSPANIMKNLADLVSESWGFAPTTASAQAYAKAGVKTYLYQFSHRSTHSVYPASLGVPHFDEVQYVFGVPWKQNQYLSKATAYTDVERGLSTMVMRLWTNLAKYGDPSNGENDQVAWPRYEYDGQKYLDITQEPRIGSKLRANRAAFWNELIPKVNKAYLKEKVETKSEETKTTTRNTEL